MTCEICSRVGHTTDAPDEKGGDAFPIPNVDDLFYPGLNAYEVLSVPCDADQREIKKSHRKLIALWHPAKYASDNKEKQQECLKRLATLNSAWSCLESDDKRKLYDDYLLWSKLK